MVSKIPPTTSFPPRRPIQRALFVFEEDMVQDLTGRVECLSPTFPDPISMFHEVTGYAYLPTPIHPRKETAPISIPDISSDSLNQATYHPASASSFTLTYILEDTFSILCQSVITQARRLIWCSAPRKSRSGTEEKPRNQQLQGKEFRTIGKFPELCREPKMDIKDQGSQAPGPSNSLWRPYSPTCESVDDSEEEEEVYALLRYGV